MLSPAPILTVLATLNFESAENESQKSQLASAVPVAVMVTSNFPVLASVVSSVIEGTGGVGTGVPGIIPPPPPPPPTGVAVEVAVAVAPGTGVAVGTASELAMQEPKEFT